jgi:phosphoribosyl-AMP cyclohydrolase / phosphoribosyl-ATP pyrophosphohydrolase
MTPAEIEQLAWDKGGGLLPVIVQDSSSNAVLMTGFVNREALSLMLERRQLVLYSRTRQRLWVKGETSGNFVIVEDVTTDCDSDALLVRANPVGPVCHTGAQSCFHRSMPAPEATHGLSFYETLHQIVTERLLDPKPESYTSRLAARGVKRIAQKVAEEAVEVALCADGPEQELLSESADLLFHLIVLLKTRGLGLEDVGSVLRLRHAEQPSASAHEASVSSRGGR